MRKSVGYTKEFAEHLEYRRTHPEGMSNVEFNSLAAEARKIVENPKSHGEILQAAREFLEEGKEK